MIRKEVSSFGMFNLLQLAIFLMSVEFTKVYIRLYCKEEASLYVEKEFCLN